MEVWRLQLELAKRSIDPHGALEPEVVPRSAFQPEVVSVGVECLQLEELAEQSLNRPQPLGTAEIAEVGLCPSARWVNLHLRSLLGLRCRL